MKINPYGGSDRPEQVQVERRQQNVPVDSDRRQGAPVTEDRAEFSAHADRIHKLRAKLESTPEVRGERVAQLRNAIRSGQYQVSTEALADAILNEQKDGPR